MVFSFLFIYFLKNPEQQVAIKQITKKQLAKSQILLEKEIKILKVKKKIIFIIFLFYLKI
jgi:hypothetical protein